MARRAECRKTGLFPAVIADIIGAYAEYTIAEKVRILVGDPVGGKYVMRDDCVSIQCTHNVPECLFVDRYDGTMILSVDELIMFAECKHIPYRTAMVPAEERAIAGWLARVE